MQERLTFDLYDKAAETTAIYPGSGEGGMEALSYLGLGLAGEAGEVADKLKKIIRDGDGSGRATTAQKLEILAELGDVLWYLSRMTNELGMDTEYVAQVNVAKLASRMERGALNGSGDDR